MDGRESVWLGEELIAVGRDGAGLWHPDSDRWTPLPAPPGELESIRTVDTPEGVVVVGISCSDRHEDSATVTCSPGGVVAARLDDDKKWRNIPVPDSGVFAEQEDRNVSLQTVVWAGDRLAAIVDGGVVTLELAAERWRELGPPPGGHADLLCETGSGAVAVQVTEGADLEEQPSAAAVLEGGEWSKPVHAPSGPSLFATGACVEGGAVVVSSRSTTDPVLWFDAERASWSSLPPPPVAFADFVRAAPGGTPSAIFAAGAELWELDVSKASWRSFTERIATDDALIAWTRAGLVLRTGDDFRLVRA